MKNSQLLSLFPEWKPAGYVLQRSKEDDEFFDQLQKAAQDAEQKHGPELTAKYGPKMPTSGGNNTGFDADRIAKDLGAKVLRK